jgi:N-acetylneuraminic acid mutarotase
MLVWGGINSSNMLNDGALYDPAANSWSALPLANVPEARANAAAVWAGDRLIVWGGEGASGELGTGAQLTFSNGLPVAWAALSATNAPSARSAHSAVWTGSRMIVWGGQAGSSPLGDGSSYNPQGNVWQALNMTNAPEARSDHAALWTGSDMVVTCGAGASGALSTSAAYDPVAAQWRSLGSSGAPVVRSVPGAVWSGTGIVLFGGLNGVQPVAALQRLVPQSAWYFYRKL